LALLIAFLVGTHISPPALAEPAREPASPGLREELGRILAGADLGGATIGVAVVDVETGEVLFESGSDQQLNPASNAKIVTAAAALAILGPEFRYHTALYGETDAAAIDGALYLRGGGDPTLTTPDLWGLATELRRRGVRTIRGDLVVDASYFDRQFEPPAFDQQPGERADFRAPVGGVSVNGNVVAVHVRPAGSPGRPGIVTADPEGYLELVNDTVTVETGAPSIRLSTRPGGSGTRARIWGSLPLGDRGTRQRSRIDNPSLFAGAALREALASLGIGLRGTVREGAMSRAVPLLADRRSEPLSSILRLLGKNSDNFVAETVLKTIGAEAARPGTWDRSRQGVARYLESVGIPTGSYTLVNGSGLFDANRFSPRQLVTILTAAWRDQTIRAEFVAQLATGGVDGTLQQRFREPPAFRHVRAKTGTLSDVTALSGYVLAPPGRHTVAFSIIINGGRGRLGEGREIQDELVEAMAEELFRR
jgi:D-alanyl-D-alanine carboxypeptidase/D-alanyl-D-alanine-endopeptidase (penicillin-binding protein 4)